MPELQYLSCHSFPFEETYYGGYENFGSITSNGHRENGGSQALIAQQKLDRVVVDECHLTVTAASYRESIVDVTLIRSLPTQFVYLTATLPPSMYAEFEERNYLLHPKVIRASSNRPNLFYMVRKIKTGNGSLLEQAAAEAQDAWNRSNLFNISQDKIILYVRTRDEAIELASLLDCTVYTARSGSAVDKGKIVADWIKSVDQPYIVATTAFAEGFDYPYVRLVINVNEPESLVLCAQESGRAGRDGERAYSFILLPSTWMAIDGDNGDQGVAQPPAIRDSSLGKRRERQAVHRYLESRQCFRTSPSEHLDSPDQRRWCMPEDVPCDSCRRCHDEPIEPPKRATHNGETVTGLTGAKMIRMTRQKEHFELARYREDLIAVRGTCLLCRATDDRWDHDFSSCSRKHEVFHERKQARYRSEAKDGEWLQRYTACFWCLNPQAVCHRASPDEVQQEGKCEDGDTVLPLCYGKFCSAGGEDWLYESFGRRFTGMEGFFDWLGEECRFGGGKAIQAVRVAAEALIDCHLY
ncbi:hypothetical protein LTR54_018193 [Friedmanniomyces endolithicus]|nr:hypothetical protein LTR54_018193 [Friedmanniomyces endolithicus]